MPRHEHIPMPEHKDQAAFDAWLNSASYREVLPWPLSDLNAATLDRYEKRLGRKLTVNEGQMLVQQTNIDGPSLLPRFTKCDNCGAWIDNGALRWRNVEQTEPCWHCHTYDF